MCLLNNVPVDSIPQNVMAYLFAPNNEGLLEPYTQDL